MYYLVEVGSLRRRKRNVERSVERYEREIAAQNVGGIGYDLAETLGLYPVGAADERFDVAEILESLGGGLRTDPVDSGDVVGSIAD